MTEDTLILIDDLRQEAELCALEHADDIAILLNRAADKIEEMSRQLAREAKK